MLARTPEARRARLHDARPRLQGVLGDDAAALLTAYGVEDVPLGESEPDAGLIGRARAERGDAPPSNPEGKTE